MILWLAWIIYEPPALVEKYVGFNKICRLVRGVFWLRLLTRLWMKQKVKCPRWPFTDQNKAFGLRGTSSTHFPVSLGRHNVFGVCSSDEAPRPVEDSLLRRLFAAAAGSESSYVIGFIVMLLLLAYIAFGSDFYLSAVKYVIFIAPGVFITGGVLS